MAKVGDKLPVDVAQSMKVGNTKRTYRLGIPNNYDPKTPTPLVMNLHGSGSNAMQASIYGDFTRQATNSGYITVTPDAIGGRWQLGGQGTDHDFLMALVTNIKSRYCVNTRRVYAIGMSLGSWKAALSACSDATTFAAVVMVAVEVHPGKCRPIPAVAFHGTADPMVPYGEGSQHSFPQSPNAGLPGTHKNIAEWARGNGCDPKPQVTKLGRDVERWRYRNCTAPLELYTVIGGGHTWPGAAIKIGPTTHTIDATQIALDWFGAHPKK